MSNLDKNSVIFGQVVILKILLLLHLFFYCITEKYCMLLLLYLFISSLTYN